MVKVGISNNIKPLLNCLLSKTVQTAFLVHDMVK